MTESGSVEVPPTGPEFNITDEVDETASAGSTRDSTYYAIRIVPPIVGVLIIIAVVTGVIWCCVCVRRAYGKKTARKYDVAYDKKASLKYEVDHIK